MDIVCPSCEKKAGSVESVARLILTAHCPFCGLDFGVAVDPPAPAATAPAAAGTSAPATS
jgi:transcription elongation factor Elf1